MSAKDDLEIYRNFVDNDRRGFKEIYGSDKYLPLILLGIRNLKMNFGII